MNWKLLIATVNVAEATFLCWAFPKSDPLISNLKSLSDFFSITVILNLPRYDCFWVLSISVFGLFFRILPKTFFYCSRTPHYCLLAPVLTFFLPFLLEVLKFWWYLCWIHVFRDERHCRIEKEEYRIYVRRSSIESIPRFWFCFFFDFLLSTWFSQVQRERCLLLFNRLGVLRSYLICQELHITLNLLPFIQARWTL